MGAITARMTNRTMQDLLTPVPHGYLNSRVDTGAIQGFDAFPDSVYGAGINAGCFRFFACSIAMGNGRKILGNLATVQCTTGYWVHRVRLGIGDCFYSTSGLAGSGVIIGR
jgi:hypothetical protein